MRRLLKLRTSFCARLARKPRMLLIDFLYSVFAAPAYSSTPRETHLGFTSSPSTLRISFPRLFHRSHPTSLSRSLSHQQAIFAY